MDLPFHPSLLPALCLAAISFPAAAAMRRAVRKEYPSLLPWLLLWGALCTVPALMFVILCLPGFGDAADWLNESIAGTWIEVLAGIAGVLPGLRSGNLSMPKAKTNWPAIWACAEQRLN